MYAIARSHEFTPEVPMTDSGIIHIAVTPPASLGVDLVSSVAGIIGKPPYQTRLLLAGEVPKVIAHCDSTEVAESIVRSLRALGLAAIACPDHELRRLAETFQVQTLELRDKEALFQDSAGHNKVVAQSEVFLVLVGRVESYLEMEAVKQKVKFSLPQTLLMGGIPIWRVVNGKTRNHSVQAESFIRLYEVQAPEPSVDIFQQHVNYSFLGPSAAASSLANFGALVQKLRDVFPNAIFDDRLAKPSALTTSARRGWADVEVTCKLIYLFHAAEKGPDQGS
jgi:hypothetical protein